MSRIISAQSTNNSASQSPPPSSGSDDDAISSLELLSNTAAMPNQATTTSISCPKTLGAKLLQPGFNCPDNNLKLVDWPKGTQKPTLNELRNEIRHRMPSSKPAYCDTDKCITILLKAPNMDAIGLALEAQCIVQTMNNNK